MAIAELWELLKADPPEWHTFFPGASDAEIAGAERALELKLPRSYVRFLRLTNGAILFDSERILGVGTAVANGHARPDDLELVATTATLRAGARPLPDHLLPFAPATDGGVDCFLLRGGLREHEYPVVFWSPTGGESEVSHDSFDEWLFELTEMLRPESDSSPSS